MASQRTSHLTPFLTQPFGGEGKKKERGKEGESVRERESTFSLDFSTIGLSNLGYWYCEVSTTSGGRSVLLLSYFLFKML